MSFISNIVNGELGSSVRAKLNALIDRMNGDPTNKNIFIGDEAGDLNTPTGTGFEGQHNAFFGDRAGAKNTTGYFNAWGGSGAGEENETGVKNTGFGFFALHLLENNDDNSAFGHEALFNAKDVWRCSAFGSEALERLEVGAYCVAFGYQSQKENIVAIRNSAFGYKTLHVNLFAFDNTAVGYKALEIVNATSGVISAYADAGGGQITVTSAGHGQSNGTTIAIRGSGIWVKPAYALNYDGSYTISNVSTDTFEITHAFVDESLLASFGVWGIESEGKNNTSLGYYAGGLITVGSYNIMIGYSAHPLDNAGDYQLNIGGLITGNMTGEKWMKVDGSLRLEPQAADPTAPVEGETYFNSTDKHFYGYNGTGWVQLDN